MYHCKLFISIIFLCVGLAACDTQKHPASSTDQQQTTDPNTPMIVKIESGKIQGSEANNGVLSFKGVPFAKAPVGDLRWAAPQSPTPWQDTLDAASYGADCMQKPFPSDAAPLGTEPAEDCLFVNVWTKAENLDKKLPVVIWIYGGGFVNGGSSPEVYSGDYFAQQDIVFVSFNYRLGRFGFFAHPALTASEGGSGNYGYMDQVFALGWVQRNISAFGGNPEQVTIMGESAGGGSVINLLTSKEAGGKFHQAIVMSGGGRGPLMGPRKVSEAIGDRKSAEWYGVNFAEQYGIQGKGPEALEALRALSAEQVTDGLNMSSMGNQQTYAGGPLVDGETSVEDPESAFSQGNFSKVPLIIGTTSMDIGFGFAPSKAAFFEQFGAQAEMAKMLYDPKGNTDVTMLNMYHGADKMMHEPAHYLATQFRQHDLPAWVYRFSYVAESMRNQWPGAPHATEIPYFLNTVEAKYQQALTALDKQASELSASYFINFVKTGNPNSESLEFWPKFDLYEPQILNIQNDAKASIGADPFQDRVELVKGLRESN
ncbi:carboxylesterase/lipase family protein [Glaciecola sp. 1036]|uniref:carboxylesterase/lipase family protein n=1 Tax=Alteromonadaceae TaxID=72275 RepID=UPI003D04D63E